MRLQSAYGSLFASRGVVNPPLGVITTGSSTVSFDGVRESETMPRAPKPDGSVGWAAGLDRGLLELYLCAAIQMSTRFEMTSLDCKVCTTQCSHKNAVKIVTENFGMTSPSCSMVMMLS